MNTTNTPNYPSQITIKDDVGCYFVVYKNGSYLNGEPLYQYAPGYRAYTYSECLARM